MSTRKTAHALSIVLAGWFCAAACGAAAQSVTSPQLDGATLRGRLAATMADPAKPMPTDAAALDTMVARKDWTALTTRLLSARTASAVLLDMNWEQRRLYDGAGFIIAYAYMTDLWRLGASQPGNDSDQLKQSAGMMMLYATTLAQIDGTKCADTTAPAHRTEQLFAQNPALWAYVRSLPRPRRMVLGTVSLAIESATATLRTNDDVLCSDGMDQMIAGLRAQNGKPLERVPNRPGTAGKTYSVPTPPGYAPRFLAEDVWRPKQVVARRSIAAELTTLLTMPGDPVSPAK